MTKWSRSRWEHGVNLQHPSVRCRKERLEPIAWGILFDKKLRPWNLHASRSRRSRCVQCRLKVVPEFSRPCLATWNAVAARFHTPNS